MIYPSAEITLRTPLMTGILEYFKKLTEKIKAQNDKTL
jgi:hypothetical protein